MKKEVLTDRIEKAEANIAKKEALITKMQDRIDKNMIKLQKLGFTDDQIKIGLDNPYRLEDGKNFEKGFNLCYSIKDAEYSIESAQKVLPELRTKLEGYKAQMQVIIEKENSRNIEVIVQFLESWKERVKEYYVKHTDDWIESLLKYYEANHEYTVWFNSHFKERTRENMKKMEAPVKEAQAVHAMYNYLDRYMIRDGQHQYHIDLDLLQKDLDYEANCKYDFIIERTNHIVGQITDASNLSIGNKGDLNGYIIGTKGTAKVQTIGAGGYNIQCYHFRTLINEMK